MLVESLESPALLILRKVEAQGPIVFANSTLANNDARSGNAVNRWLGS